jgi:Rrf2 family protein
MPYSASCKYALRALAYISLRTEAEGPLAPVLGSEIAAAEGIPPSFLARVLRDLVRQRLIRSKPGRGGGYSLRLPPQEIRVTDIIAAVDGARDLTRTCVLGLGICSDESPCELHEIWSKYRQVYLAALAPLTLADLAETLKAKRQNAPPKQPEANRSPFDIR